MPARKKPRNLDLQVKRDSIMNKTLSDYAKQADAADAVGGNTSKRFAQSMDSTRRVYNKTADAYSSEMARRDSVENVKETNRIRQAKSPAAARGGEVTPEPPYKPRKKGK